MPRRTRQGRPIWIPGDLYKAIVEHAGEKKAANFVRDAVVRGLSRKYPDHKTDGIDAPHESEVSSRLDQHAEQIDTVLDHQRQLLLAIDDIAKTVLAVNRTSIEASAHRTAHAGVSVQSLAILENILTLLLDHYDLGATFEAREEAIQARFSELRRVYFSRDRAASPDQQQGSRA